MGDKVKGYLAWDVTQKLGNSSLSFAERIKAHRNMKAVAEHYKQLPFPFHIAPPSGSGLLMTQVPLLDGLLSSLKREERRVGRGKASRQHPQISTARSSSHSFSTQKISPASRQAVSIYNNRAVEKGSAVFIYVLAKGIT